VGETGVGKSCLLLRLADGNFTAQFIHTIGVDFKSRVIPVQDKMCKLQVWDTAGQERFRTITNSFYRKVSGVILAFDITDQKSFQNVSNWLEDIKKNTNPGTALILVGNKCDLEQQRTVPYQTAKKYADQHDLFFIETSAKNGTGVDAAFQTLAVQILNRYNMNLEAQVHPQEEVSPVSRGCYC